MGRKMGQTWSIDLILAAGIFILFIIAFYLIISNQGDDVQEDLEDSADEIVIRLESEAGPSSAGIIKSGRVNDTRLAELSNKDYQELKDILGISSDFCIFLEDDNGRLIPINGSKIGVGGDQISINGQPCNSTIG